MTIITLESSDNDSFKVDIDIAKKSITIKTMLDDLGFTDEEQSHPIPLPKISGSVLKRVLEWCTQHKDDPPVVEDDNAEKRTDDISDWDKKFLDVEQRTLFDIILAANYLDIKGLLDVACKTVANMLKGKTPEEIRNTFKIDDMTEDISASASESTTSKEEATASTPKDSEPVEATCSA